MTKLTKIAMALLLMTALTGSVFAQAGGTTGSTDSTATTKSDSGKKTHKGKKSHKGSKKHKAKSAADTTPQQK